MMFSGQLYSAPYLPPTGEAPILIEQAVEWARNIFWTFRKKKKKNKKNILSLPDSKQCPSAAEPVTSPRYRIPYPGLQHCSRYHKLAVETSKAVNTGTDCLVLRTL
jgi:hypothetical protein